MYSINFANVNFANAIGIFGAVLLIIGWLWETGESIKVHKITIHTHFAVIYIIGNLALAGYAWLIGSQIFFWLTIFLLITIICEFLYSKILLKKSVKNFKHGK
ncbi:MAG: hypothetical protein ACP5IJ_01815 [Candidatus Nanoarchaeia archaeon]